MRKAGLVFVVALLTVLVCLIFSAVAQARFRDRRRASCCPCTPCVPCSPCDLAAASMIPRNIPPFLPPEPPPPGTPTIINCADVGRVCFCCVGGLFVQCDGGGPCAPGTTCCWREGDPIPICLDGDRWPVERHAAAADTGLYGMVPKNGRFAYAKRGQTDVGYYRKAQHNQLYELTPPRNTPKILANDAAACAAGRQWYHFDAGGNWVACGMACNAESKACWKVGDPKPKSISKPDSFGLSAVDSYLYAMKKHPGNGTLTWARPGDTDVAYFARSFFGQEYVP